jgi:hypothetical protein
MPVWKPAEVLTLAPDQASASAGQQLAGAHSWLDVGCSDRAVWGRCRGSGVEPYTMMVGLEPPSTFACSCPSRKAPCKHVLGLLLTWSAGSVGPAVDEPVEVQAWLSARSVRRRTRESPAGSLDPAAAAKTAAERRARVDEGLEELDRWLLDQVRGGLAGLERAGFAHFDRMAARMVDAQAPGVAGLLRAIPGQLSGDGWPGRLLDRLAALHLLAQAHQRLDSLPPDLASTVRSRVGYPVSKKDVLASQPVPDLWAALGGVDQVEYQLQTRRVWLHGLTTGRWALWLTFAPPGQDLDTSIKAGVVYAADAHFYPGAGQYRALFDNHRDVAGDAVPALPSGGTLEAARHRFATLLSLDPWASRMPVVLAGAPVPPRAVRGPWVVRDEAGGGRTLLTSTGEPWPLLATSRGELVALFGEWSVEGFAPLALLPDHHGRAFSLEVAA